MAATSGSLVSAAPRTFGAFSVGPLGFDANEVVLGQVLAASPGLRERMVLTTKGGITPPMPYNPRYEYLISACEDSLRRLQVESVDLYQIHRPDLYTHPEEVARALITLRESGKIGEVGVSNFVTHPTDALATGEGVSSELLAVMDGLAERLADATTALTVQLDRNDVYALFQASEGVPLP